MRGLGYNDLHHPYKCLAVLPSCGLARHQSLLGALAPLLRILFASPPTQHALEASFGAWHGRFCLVIYVIWGLMGNGVPLADGVCIHGRWIPYGGSVHTLKDAAPRG